MTDRPVDTAADVAAVKDLLLWMRKQGFWSETVTVGSVQLVTARDYLPDVKAQERAAAAEDERNRKGGESVGSAYAEFGRDLPGYEDVVGGRS